MIKLKSGYYSYSQCDGISYIAPFVCMMDLPYKATLVSPNKFKDIVLGKTYNGTYICRLDKLDAILSDIHYEYDIKGLYDY